MSRNQGERALKAWASLLHFLTTEQITCLPSNTLLLFGYLGMLLSRERTYHFSNTFSKVIENKEIEDERKKGRVGATDRLPQDETLWHEYCFELKVIKTQQTQKKLSSWYSTAYIYIGKKKLYQEECYL